MSEASLERYFIRRVQQECGAAIKFTSPMESGLPDRLVFFEWLPLHTFYVELKKQGKTPRKDQIVQHRRFSRFGNPVWVIDNKAQVNHFIYVIKKL
jgi:hypothetical protein